MSLPVIFRKEQGPRPGPFCKQTENEVVKLLNQNGIAIDPKKPASKIVPVDQTYSDIYLRQYQYSDSRFRQEAASKALSTMQTTDPPIKSVEKVSVEIGRDAAIVGFHFVVGFWRNDI
jgi:hypothetical protein